MKNQLALFSIVWHKREYRAFFLIMGLLSLAISTTLPLITLYLVDDLHVALSTVALFFVGESLLGLVLGLAVGRMSDGWHSRLPAMRLAAIWVAVGWLVFVVSPNLWLTLAVGGVFISAGSIIMGQAFAALHDVMVRDAEPQPGLVNATIRTGFSFGFVLGPLLGSQLAAWVSFRAAFLVAGCLSLLCIAPLHGLRVPVASHTPQASSQNGRGQSNALLYVFVGLCTLVLTGTALKITYLPIDVTKHLGGTIAIYGTIMAVSPIAELITMPGSGLLALRFRIGRLLSVAFVLATIEYVILFFSTSLWQVYAAQALDAVVVGALFGLGLTYAQQLSPGRAGLASSAFGSAFGIATLVGNLIGGAGVSLLGVPHIFFIAVVMCGVALATFLGIDRTASRQVESVGQEALSI